LTLAKIIVVCLALSNVGYFLWAHGIARSHETASGLPAVATLKLASEVPASARAAATAASSIAESSGDNATAPGHDPDTAGPSTTATRCVTVGPFRDVSEASRAASTLRGGGYDPRQRVVDGEVWAGVWVYIPLPPNRAASDQLTAKLKAAGIDDALEMPGPTEGSVMSLGLFSEQKRAQARVAQAQALGLNPGIADRKRTGNVYWIDIDLKPSDDSINPADLQGEAGRINRLEVKACPPAAVVQP
jgi:hypothetical protein